MNTRFTILMLTAFSVVFHVGCAGECVNIEMGKIQRGERKVTTTAPEGLPVKFELLKIRNGKLVLDWQRTGSKEEMVAALKKFAAEKGATQLADTKLSAEQAIRGVKLKLFTVTPDGTVADYATHAFSIPLNAESGSEVIHVAFCYDPSNSNLVAKVDEVLSEVPLMFFSWEIPSENVKGEPRTK